MKNARLLVVGAAITLSCFSARAERPDLKTLPIGLAPHDRGVAIPRAARTAPPAGYAHSLGEWEEAESVMVLWPNSSLISALAARGNVTILCDSESDRQWWLNWLAQNGIDAANVSFLIVPTNSIWVRDYGPWFILDGNGGFGIVDTWYNRPRPLDDVVPGFIAQELNIPMYVIGLTHTGGNYYSDGVFGAFSSTLVYTENASLTQAEVDQRMADYLGVLRYTTGQLAPGITIEHFDTFGKLVAPDTFVFSSFPKGSVFREDSENMVRRLSKLTSPYGTPYKIYRMRMIVRPGSSGEDYRAYINSLISNGVVYMPAYGDAQDDLARAVYEQALPGYEVVPVTATSTEWGDSVHCRTRNLMEADTIFIFPSIRALPGPGEDITVTAHVFASPGAQLASTPLVYWQANGGDVQVTQMANATGSLYVATLPGQAGGTSLRMMLEAADTAGIVKRAPANAPQMTIDFRIK